MDNKTDYCILYLFTCDINNVNNVNNEVNIITSYITNQHLTLWDIFKIGDFIENTITHNKFIIRKSTKLKIAQNNLILEPLYKNNFIPFYFYSITQFKLNYFDNLHVNYDYTDNKFYNVINYYKQPIYLDIDKLQFINNISVNNIYHHTINKFSQLFNNKYTIDYLYIILVYKNENYMFISKYSNEFYTYNMALEKIKFISQFTIYNNTYFLENIISDDIINIANVENVNEQNIIYLIGTKILY